MIAIIDAGSSKVPDIERHVEKCGHIHRTFRLEDLAKDTLEHASAIIISGSPLLIQDRLADDLAEQGAHIFSHDKPILGICFGHQLMAICFGGEVKDGEEDRAIQEIQKAKDHPIFNGFEDEFEMREDHCEEASVPPEFELLATSAKCDNEAMVHNSRPLVGVQFHPESSELNGHQFFKNFIDHYVK